MRAPLALLLPALAACQPPATPTTRPAPIGQQYTLIDLVGGWRWIFRTEEDGTSRVEDEHWRLRPDPQHPTQLAGRYVRAVEVRSTDRLPFRCNQRPHYLQRTVYDLTVELTASGFTAHETNYATEPSPCDHGFRHVGDYTVEPSGNRLVLRFDGGTQTLWQIDNDVDTLPSAPWPAVFEPTGAWRWDATSYDDDNNLRDESEWWEITRRNETRLDITYRRRVTVRHPDGKPIACANAPSWTYDDAYVLDGQREEEHWHFYERGVEPGDHPCLRTTPKRALDEATAEQIGDYLVLEWRGKRRQVLYRPER